MQVKIGRHLRNVYALDFETHNDEESVAKNETSIWLSCMIDEKSTLKDDIFDYSMDEVLTRLECLALSEYPLIYIYNLSFEWSFILPVLIKRGFKWVPEIGKNDCYCFSSVSTKTCTSVWSAQIRFGPLGHVIEFRDLSKLYPGGLGRIARDMGLPTQKGEIDYALNRLHDYKVTDEEREYCFKDVKIVMDILEKVKDDKIFWKSLSAASYAAANMVKAGYPRAKDPYSLFRRDYPRLEKTEDEFVRNSVSGGITYATPRYQFLDINQRLIHIDAVQMHPSSAYLNKFPCGYGKYGKGKPKISPYEISCCHIFFSYDDVKLHSVISCIGYPFMDKMELWVWDFEIPTMLKVYENAKIEYIDHYTYLARHLPWREFYRENLEGREREKKAGHLFLALRYKLLNNSSYGKLIEHGHQYDRENIIGIDGIINSIDHPNEERPEDGKYTYVPVGSCVPAYSRVRLIETAYLLGWKNVVYFDTDTIVAVDCSEVRDAISKLDMERRLGGWTREADILHAQFAAPKRYKAMEEGNGLVVHCAGFQVPTKVEFDNGMTYDVPFDEINIVDSSWRVTRAYRAKGGTLINFQRKDMSVQDKYKEVYNANSGR